MPVRPVQVVLLTVSILLPNTGLLAQSDEQELTALPPFATVLSAALSQSLEAKRASLIRDQATIDRRLVTYGSLPKIGLSGTWAERHPQASEPRDQTYELRLNYNIYDFGRTSAKKSQADYWQRIQSLNIEQANEALTWHVARLYLNLLSSTRLLQISAENFTTSQSKLTTTKDNYQKGLRSENDLLAAEGDLGEARLTLEQSKADVLIQRKQLEPLMGTSFATSNLKPKSLLTLKPAPSLAKLVESWKSLASVAQTKRIVEKQELEASERAIIATQLPTLDLQVGAQEAGTWEKTARTYNGQIQLTWDIPWSGQHRVEREKISLQRQVIETDEAMELRERKEVIASALDRFSVYTRLSAAVEDQLSLRSRQYKLIKLRYDSGKATSLELSNSELELGKTRLEREKIANALASAVLDIAEAKRVKDPGIIFSPTE